MDLTEFLLARIAEDEDQARAATPSPWVPGDQGWDDANGQGFIVAPYHELDISDEDAQHITRWQPARILAECSAKRQIVETYERLWQRAEELRQAGRDANAATARAIYSGVEMVVGYLALPYADHSDYDPEWRP